MKQELFQRRALPIVPRKRFARGRTMGIINYEIPDGLFYQERKAANSQNNGSDLRKIRNLIKGN
jgi:hypothetical protein